MRIALISDLHANELALEAVLADLRTVGVDQLVCLGDVATLGPRPLAVLQRLRDLACPCILGNHDEFLLRPELVRAYTDAAVIVDAVEWTRRQLGDEERAQIAAFVPHLTLPLPGDATLSLYHGSPRSNTEDVLATTPPEELDAMLGERAAEVMAGGHTHIQMLRQHRGVLVVNPGSVGMPFEAYVGGKTTPRVLPHAEYGIVEAAAGAVRVTLHRVRLDRAALRAAAAACDSPMREALLRQYV
jgi:putative phosphoesterase